jgi:mannose-6-phosphate isomerase-like protein (cupin superfamily)
MTTVCTGIRRIDIWLTTVPGSIDRVIGIDERQRMQVFRPTEYTADRAWGAVDIERLADATVRLHWTDQPYAWHVNEGPEVFVVVDGIVDMHVRGVSGEFCCRLNKGDIFHAEEGDEHRAKPVGAARILVVERAGSV